MITTLSRIAETHRLARLTRHGELVLMRNAPDVTIGTAQVTLPPGSFLQATTAGEEALAALVRDIAGSAKHIADLFCGVGPFALRLARRARVSAFDSDAGAVAALQKAATATSGLKPVKAEARDLFRRPLMPPELRDYDAVVFDPPRQGAQAQAHAACREQGAGGDRRLLQRRDLCPRRQNPGRWRLQDRSRDAGRPVPAHAACRAGGAVLALKMESLHADPILQPHRACASPKCPASPRSRSAARARAGPRREASDHDIGLYFSAASAPLDTDRLFASRANASSTSPMPPR